MKLLWTLMNLIDAVLDHLSEDRRWQLINFLMLQSIMKCCRVDGYFWATCIGDESIFDLGECNLCAGQPSCYCGKVRP